jgi:uncharacterized protein YlzI (FlbEa/FlbD family)
MFVKLTAGDGRASYVNADTVTRIERHGDHTGIYFDHGNGVSVKETPEQVLAAMGSARFPKPGG